jgi:osmotically-inducible protein OsmY
MKKFNLTFFIVLLFSLLGCVNTAITGAQAIYDRHNLQHTLNDQYITIQANRALYWHSEKYKKSSIAISTFNGNVLLTGSVPSAELHAEIEDIVKKIPGTKKVYNLTEVSRPSSALTQVSDTWITAKVKAQLIAMDEIDPSKIKVVTENGTVYLMGIIFPQQAQIAVQVARTTAGVQNVVKIFSYLHISKTA